MFPFYAWKLFPFCFIGNEIIFGWECSPCSYASHSTLLFLLHSPSWTRSKYSVVAWLLHDNTLGSNVSYNTLLVLHHPHFPTRCKYPSIPWLRFYVTLYLNEAQFTFFLVYLVPLGVLMKNHPYSDAAASYRSSESRHALLSTFFFMRSPAHVMRIPCSLSSSLSSWYS